MPSQYSKCTLCRTKFRYDGSWARSDFCIKCDLAFFQVEESLNLYIEGDPPQWLRDAIMHMGWIFESYPLTAAYLNLATEVMFDFVIGRETTIEDDDLTELNYMRISPNRVKRVLADAFLVNVRNGILYPGPLVTEISNIRLTEYDLGSEEFQAKVREVRGVLSVALTMALVKRGRFKPQRPLCLFRILAQNIINSGLEDSNPVGNMLSETSFDDACVSISARQRKRLRWHISGFSTGRPYLIENIDEDMNILFDETIVRYMNRMRERYRERNRQRDREL